jgi:hypothetical protein
LMNLWKLLTCKRVEIVEDDPNNLAAVLDDGALLERCFRPASWREFLGLVQLEANETILPVRSRYDSAGPVWQIGVNPLTCTRQLWYSIPDVISAILPTGRAPRILRVIRLVPAGVSSSLRPTLLRGTVPVDPRTQDFFRIVTEERMRRKTDTEAEATQGDRVGPFLKVLGNAGSYGIYAQMDRRELPGSRRDAVRVYGLEGPFETKVSAPEEPGEFSFPPMAASITGGARLMLALLERMVTDAGSTFAFCDTDSMAVVATENGDLVPCPGGSHRLPDGREAIQALSWEQLEDLRERFTALNPYDQQVIRGSILKLEPENFDPKTGRRRQLWCFAISAKRYALYNRGRAGTPILRKWLEHGLGHLLNPADPDNGDRNWIRQIWEGIVTEDVLGKRYPWPDWLIRPAVGRITVSSPSLLRLFRHLNQDQQYPDQIKPSNFLLTVFVNSFGHPSGTNPERFQLVAPSTPDPSQWLKLGWIDRYSGKTFRVRIRGDSGNDGVARVKTYADVIADYRMHPESKSLGPDSQPCSRQTLGLLRRRPVNASEVRYIGKESNRLDDRAAGLVHDTDEVVIEYRDPRHDPWTTTVLPDLRKIPLRVLIIGSGLSERALREIRAGRSTPHRRNRIALTKLVQLERR